MGWWDRRVDAYANQIKSEMRRAAARVWNLVSRGIVRRVTERKLQAIQVETAPGRLSDEVERFGEWGLASRPLPGAEAVMVCKNGNDDVPIIVGVEDRRNRPTDLADGDVCLYNAAGDRVWLKGSRTLLATVNGASVEASSSKIKLAIGSSSIEMTSSGIVIKSPSIDFQP